MAFNGRSNNQSSSRRKKKQGETPSTEPKLVPNEAYSLMQKAFLSVLQLMALTIMMSSLLAILLKKSRSEDLGQPKRRNKIVALMPDMWVMRFKNLQMNLVLHFMSGQEEKRHKK